MPRHTWVMQRLHRFALWLSSRTNRGGEPSSSPGPIDEFSLEASGDAHDADVAANAAAAASDVRNSVDHQVRSASEFDTKLSALVTVVGTAAGLAAPRLALDEPIRVSAFIVSGLLVALTIALAFLGLRPRAASFGADPTALGALVTDHRGTFERELLNGLINAYTANQCALESKAASYRKALLGFFIALLSIGLLIATGALH